jgi:uncharacterized protein YraI
MRQRLSPLLIVLSLLLLTVAPMMSNAQDTNGQVKRMSTLLRLRETPSPTGAVINELIGLTPLILVGRTIDNNWLKVQTTDGQTGWVAAGYVDAFIALTSLPIMTADGSTVTTPTVTTPTTATDAPAQTVEAAGGAAVKRGITLRLRQEPSTTAAVLRDLAGGTPLEIIGRTADGIWLNVNATGQIGWVAALYVESVSTSVVGTVTTGNTSPTVTVRGVSAIYQRGKALGNNYGRFAKVGDSITVSEYSYDALGRGQYNLGAYAGLQRIINTFSTSSFNSFTHVSAAARGGWTTANVLDPASRNTALCQTEITPLECELDRIRPSIALIQFGTNDIVFVSPDQFAFNLNRIIDICIDRGVVPVLTTIPHREGYDGNVDTYSNIIRDVAANREIPLWDLRASLDNLPNRGLSGDGIHPSFPPGGYADSANFANSEALQAGYVTRNLTALQVLERVLGAF